MKRVSVILLAPYRAGAGRFDVGNYNFPGVVTVAPAIRLLLDLGQQEVQSYVFDLARKFTDRIIELGLPVFGGRPGTHSSHIVTLGAARGQEHDVSSDSGLTSLYQYLVASGVRLSIRGGLLRFSFHIYNNEQDVEKIIELVAEWIETHAADAKHMAGK